MVAKAVAQDGTVQNGAVVGACHLSDDEQVAYVLDDNDERDGRHQGYSTPGRTTGA